MVFVEVVMHWRSARFGRRQRAVDSDTESLVSSTPDRWTAPVHRASHSSCNSRTFLSTCRRVSSACRPLAARTLHTQKHSYHQHPHQQQQQQQQRKRCRRCRRHQHHYQLYNHHVVILSLKPLKHEPLSWRLVCRGLNIYTILFCHCLRIYVYININYFITFLFVY